MRRPFIVPAAALLALAAGCQTRPAEVEDRAPVRGTVAVAGRPAVGLLVRFHLRPGTADARAPQVVDALTDAAGAFAVSQSAPNDGLAPGKYAVTFSWPVGGDPDAPPSADQLKGRYADPDKSAFQVEVKPGDNRLPPFELK